MRDLLTALAGAIVLVLIAALAVPPFIDWSAQRSYIDHAVSASLGLPVRSEGSIAVRLLPSPHVRFERLIVGEAGGPSLEARAVDAEIALPPLLQSEMRFFDTRIGRAELRLPTAGDDALRLPPRLFTELRDRKLAIDDLHVGQFAIVTTSSGLSASPSASERFSAADLRIGTPSLLGPWRIEGTSGGVPFRAASGTPDAGGALPVKISGGGDTAPAFEVDARIGLAPGPSDPAATVITAEGKARLVVGPPTQAAGAYLPFTLAGSFTATGLDVRFDPVSLEVDPGGKPLRLEGTGRLDLHRWRAGLSLKARRLDLDAFLTSPEGSALLARGVPRGGWGLPVMLDLDTAIDSAAFGGAEWSNLSLAATLERGGGVLLRRFAVTAPGDATLTASGEVEGTPLQLNGPVSLTAPHSDELGRLLRRLGFDDPLLDLFDGRPLDLAADVSASADNLSLRSLRATFGTARLTGNARLVAPSGTGRGRFDAQLRAAGLDIAALPPLGTALDALRNFDFALTLQAEDVRYGSAGPAKGTPSGTIAAKIQSNGSGLVVESLDIADLAGASAKLSGTLAADGSGRIGGRITAPVAAPLVGLLERVWTGDLRRLPAFLRDAPLDLSVTLDRAAAEASGLRLQAKGRAGGGSIDLSATSRDGRLVAGQATLAGASAAQWFGRSDIPALDRPAEIRLTADPSPAGLAVTLAGQVAGTTLATRKPLHWPTGGSWPSDGDVLVRSTDLTPFLTLAGAAQLDPGPWPAEATVSFGTDAGAPVAGIAGQVAGSAIDARLSRGADGVLRGRVGLDRLSLPQVAAALVMPQAGPRFGALPERYAASLDVTVATLDLGRGFTAAKARFGLGLDADSLTLGGLSGTLAGGRLAGAATLNRRGETLSITGEGRIEDAALSGLAGTARLGGRFSAEWRAATSADTQDGLVADLAGGGRLTLTGLTLADLDPAALGRALTRTVEGDDPLREGRLAALLTEELAKGSAKGSDKGRATAKGPASAPATIVGGVLRAGPLTVDFGAARWVGTVTETLRDGRLEARGLLTDETVPPGWQAGPPSVQLTLSGPPGALERSVDVGPLTNGLAAFVLQRELDQIGLLQADDLERQRRRARIEMDKARIVAKAAAEEAAKEAAKEAARAAAREAAKEAAPKDPAPKEPAQRESPSRDPAPANPVPGAPVMVDPTAPNPAAGDPAPKTPD